MEPAELGAELGDGSGLLGGEGIELADLAVGCGEAFEGAILCGGGCEGGGACVLLCSEGGASSGVGGVGGVGVGVRNVASQRGELAT